MKCRACWSDKAYIRDVKGWRGMALGWLGIVPLKCHHCYHKFSVLAPMTWGKQLAPPQLKTPAARTPGALNSHSARSGADDSAVKAA